jgi:hypothetical protein
LTSGQDASYRDPTGEVAVERLVERGEGRVTIDLDGIREAHVLVEEGDVAVAGTPTPARLEAECVAGPPIEVVVDDGVLTVQHRPERLGVLAPLLRCGDRRRASVALALPPETPVRVRTLSAPVLAAGLVGSVDTATVSGPVTGTALLGRCEVRTVSGDIDLEGVSGDLGTTTISGDLTVVAGRLRRLSTRTTSGDVNLDLEVPAAARYDCTTVSGDVIVRLPPEAGIEVESRSVRRPRRRWRLGDGDARLSVRTVSGDVAVLDEPRAAA